MNFLRKKLILIFFSALLSTSFLYADVPHFIDFKYILNQSEAGKKAQTGLKKILDKGVKDLREKEKKIVEEEKKLIEQKKLISAEEYKKKVQLLRSDMNKLQKQRINLISETSKKRNLARNELLKNLNPIIKDYMKSKNIRMVIDKKSLLLADEKLDITKDILALLNKQLKSIKIN